MAKSNFLDILRFYRDKYHVSKSYRQLYNQDINWTNPTKYSEKLNILKISPRIEELSHYTDKYLVRDYISQQIGAQYLIPLLGVYSSADEIDFNLLPSPFVLKTNHGSGMNIICANKSSFDITGAIRQLNAWMNANYYHSSGHERQYRNIDRKILCEAYLGDTQLGLPDYKFHCFAGKPEFIRVMLGRQHNIQKSTLDLNWHKPPFTIISEHEVDPSIIPKPPNFNKMISLVEQLAKPFSQVRVDLYNVTGKIYFGELTFTPAAGMLEFEPLSYDKYFGAKFDLSAPLVAG